MEESPPLGHVRFSVLHPALGQQCVDGHARGVHLRREVEGVRLRRGGRGGGRRRQIRVVTGQHLPPDLLAQHVGRGLVDDPRLRVAAIEVLPAQREEEKVVVHPFVGGGLDDPGQGIGFADHAGVEGHAADVHNQRGHVQVGVDRCLQRVPPVDAHPVQSQRGVDADRVARGDDQHVGQGAEADGDRRQHLAQDGQPFVHQHGGDLLLQDALDHVLPVAQVGAAGVALGAQAGAGCPGIGDGRIAVDGRDPGLKLEDGA